MALAIGDILDKVISHAMASGLFEAVNGHEPANAPTTGGLTAAVWVDDLMPVRSSGLASTSALLTVSVRLYTSMLAEPRDQIDPAMVSASDELFRAYIGDFQLGGDVRHVDVHGIHGTPLRARAGYIQQSQTALRVMTITLPLIVNDLWEEAP